MIYKNTKTINVGKAARILIADLGFDLDRLLLRANLPNDLLDADDGNISIGAYFRLSDALTEETNDLNLALKLGDAGSIDYFDPAFFAAMCSPNMNIAIARLAEYKQLSTPFSFPIKIKEDETHIAYTCDTNPNLPPILALTEIVFLVNFARRATRYRVEPLNVTMPFDMPKSKEIEDHFGCEILQGPLAAMSLSAEDAERPFVTHDDKMWSFFEPQLRSQIENNREFSTMEERVTHCLAELLPNGRATIDVAARQLALSKRTLQRRLTKEGTTWQDVLNKARKQLAKHYLISTELGTAEISFLLGFEDPNSLYRAFRRWENTSPDLWRAKKDNAGI